jgi:hypothetical protein
MQIGPWRAAARIRRRESRIATRWVTRTFERPRVSPLRSAARTVVRRAAHPGAHSRPDEGPNQDLAAGAVAVAQTSPAQQAGSRREPRKSPGCSASSSTPSTAGGHWLSRVMSILHLAHEVRPPNPSWRLSRSERRLSRSERRLGRSERRLSRSEPRSGRANPSCDSRWRPLQRPALHTRRRRLSSALQLDP